MNKVRTTVDGAGSVGTHPQGTVRTVVEVTILIRLVLVVILRTRSTREVHRVPFQPLRATYNIENCMFKAHLHQVESGGEIEAFPNVCCIFFFLFRFYLRFCSV